MTLGWYNGGFIFGLADHAAMLAVNDPNVVLARCHRKIFKARQSRGIRHRRSHHHG